MDSTPRHRCLSTVDRLVLERGELDPLEFLLAMGCLAGAVVLHHQGGTLGYAVGAGDMCFAAAHHAHGFEDFTDDFAIWVIFYGPLK